MPSSKGLHTSSEGVINLKWSLVDAETFQLVAATPDEPDHFQIRYQGNDHSSVQSGMREGVHTYMVRAIQADGSAGVWSKPLRVKVEYMPANRVRLLMILGGVVVLMTVIAILHGHLTHRGEEAKA